MSQPGTKHEVPINRADTPRDLVIRFACAALVILIYAAAIYGIALGINSAHEEPLPIASTTPEFLLPVEDEEPDHGCGSLHALPNPQSEISTPQLSILVLTDADGNLHIFILNATDEEHEPGALPADQI